MTFKKGVLLFLENDCGVFLQFVYVFENIYVYQSCTPTKLFKSVCFAVCLQFYFFNPSKGYQPQIKSGNVLMELKPVTQTRISEKNCKSKIHFLYLTDCQRLHTNLYCIHFVSGSFVNNRTHNSLRIITRFEILNGTYLKDTCISDIAI